MMKRDLETLASDVVGELQRLRYNPHTIQVYKNSFELIIAFAVENQETCFSEKLGLDYLNKFFDYSEAVKNDALTMKIKNALRVVRLLGDYQLHDTILRRRSRTKQLLQSDKFIALSAKYLDFCRKQDYALGTQEVYQKNADKFLAYLEAQRISEVAVVSPMVIDNYLKTMLGYRYKSVEIFLCGLRSFLRFLNLFGYHTMDLSLSIPRLKARTYGDIPSVWTEDEVKKMIESIDRANPMGKRDYAILLLVVRLGIRSGDVRNLRMENVLWKENKLRFVQQKTLKTLELPLLKDVGWAIIDYLKYGRPESDSEYIFIAHRAPFKPLDSGASLYKSMAKCLKNAGISIETSKKKGLHSLRHTLASTLLEKHVELSTISEVLGHTSIESTSVYLKTSIELLRECALSPEEVLSNE